MNEYLNLLNRVHEGVIVLDYAEQEGGNNNILFCSEEASNILTLSPINHQKKLVVEHEMTVKEESFKDHASKLSDL